MPRIGPGSPEPLGVTLTPGGVNVAVFSAHATAIELCLFDAQGTRELARIALPERTGDVFHGFVFDIAAGQRYGLRAHGAFDPRNGHRFNPAKLLIDPYARALDRHVAYDPAMTGSDAADAAPDRRDSAEMVAKAIVVASPPRDRIAAPGGAVVGHDHLRAQRPRLHEDAFRGPAGAARNARRTRASGGDRPSRRGSA